MLAQVVVEVIGLVTILAAVITVISSFTHGGLDEVDTRIPNRRFPK